MNIIDNPLTPDEENELLALKARMDADKNRFDELMDKLKAEQTEDGILVCGGQRAIVLYSQHRINDAKFRSAYPQNKNPNYYKLAPDTTKIRKALNEEQIIAVSTPVRAAKFTSVEEALADAEKFSKN